MILISDYDLSYLEDLSYEERKLEYKHLNFCILVNHLCENFTDAKIDNDKDRSINISIKLSKLRKFRHFNIKKYHYYEMFIEEVCAFHITKKFIDIDYSTFNGLFENIQILREIYS